MNPKKRLGEMLIDAGIIDPTQLQAALGFQRQWGVRLGQALVDLKLASEPQIVDALARKFGFPVARLDALDPYALEQAMKLVPGEFAARNNLLPLSVDPSSVTVAMSDPTNLSVVDELSFRTGRRVKVQIAGDRAIAAALRRHCPGARTQVEAIALDLDADEATGEPVLDPFGGGSNDALEAFFGSAPTPAPAPKPTRAPAPPPPRPIAVVPEPELDDEVLDAREALLGEVPDEGLAELDPAHLSPAELAPEVPRSAPPSPVAAADRAPERPFTEGERAILDEVGRLASGAHADPAIVKPAQAMAALIRLLVRRGIVSEREFLDELLQR